MSCQRALEFPTPAPIPLLDGRTLQRSLVSGESHCYVTYLNEGDYLELEVMQRQVDLILNLEGPQTNMMVDGFTSSFCREQLRFCAPTSGNYFLRLSSLEAGRGAYELRVLALRAANASERRKAEVQKRLCEAALMADTEAAKVLAEAVAAAAPIGDPLVLGEALFAQALNAWRGGHPSAAMESLHEAAQHFAEGGDGCRAALAEAEPGLHLMETKLNLARGYLAQARAYAQASSYEELGLNLQCGVAWNLLEQGLFQDAIGVYAEVLREAPYLSDPAFRAREEMALCYRATGRTAYARDLTEAARTYWLQQGKTHAATRTLTELGTCWLLEDQPARALPLLREAVAMGGRLNDVAIEGGASDRLGSAYRRLKRFSEAEAAFRRALVLLNGQGPQQLANVHTNLAELYLDWDDSERALAQVDLAIGLFERVQARFSLAHAMAVKARSLRRLGRQAEALAVLEHSYGIIDHAAGSEGNRLLPRHFNATHFQYYLGYVAALTAVWEEDPSKHLFQQRAFEVVERVRAHDLMARMVHRRLDDPSARLTQRGPHLDHLHGQMAADQEVRAQLRKAEREQARGGLITGSAPAPPGVNLEDIQNNLLDEQTTLLAYTLDEPRSYLWVVTSQEVHTLFLPPAGALNYQARHLRALWASPGEADSSQARQYAQALSESLLAAALPLVRGKRLVLLKDGQLQYLPFAALPDPRDDKKPLVASFQLVSLPSARVGLWLQQTAVAPRARKTVLAFTDPVFEAGDNRLPPQVRDAQAPLAEFGRLNQSAREAAALARWVAPEQRTLIAGLDATREAFLAVDPGAYTMVHLALHGVLHERHPELSGLVFSTYGKDGPRQGILRAHALSGIRLDNELVVLSGCKTALGKDYAGEGSWSLGRDFMAAGARRVLVSQWDVGDGPTADLMTLFYEGLLGRGLDPDAALQQAQNRMRLDGADVSAWASFTLMGHWTGFLEKPHKK